MMEGMGGMMMWGMGLAWLLVVVVLVLGAAASPSICSSAAANEQESASARGSALPRRPWAGIDLALACGESQAASMAAAIADGKLYAGHCASCHGASLEGQPDWKSPLPSGGCRRRRTTLPAIPGIIPTACSSASPRKGRRRSSATATKATCRASGSAERRGDPRRPRLHQEHMAGAGARLSGGDEPPEKEKTQ